MEKMKNIKEMLFKELVELKSILKKIEEEGEMEKMKNIKEMLFKELVELKSILKKIEEEGEFELIKFVHTRINNDELISSEELLKLDVESFVGNLEMSREAFQKTMESIKKYKKGIFDILFWEIELKDDEDIETETDYEINLDCILRAIKIRQKLNASRLKKQAKDITSFVKSLIEDGEKEIIKSERLYFAEDVFSPAKIEKGRLNEYASEISLVDRETYESTKEEVENFKKSILRDIKRELE